MENEVLLAAQAKMLDVIQDPEAYVPRSDEFDYEDDDDYDDDADHLLGNVVYMFYDSNTDQTRAQPWHYCVGSWDNKRFRDADVFGFHCTSLRRCSSYSWFGDRYTVLRNYLTWVLEESPWSHLYNYSSIDQVLESGVYFDANQCSKEILTALAVVRWPTEACGFIGFWEEMAMKRKQDPLSCFIMSHMFNIRGCGEDKILALRKCNGMRNDHAPLGTPYFFPPLIKAVMLGERVQREFIPLNESTDASPKNFAWVTREDWSNYYGDDVPFHYDIDYPNFPLTVYKHTTPAGWVTQNDQYIPLTDDLNLKTLLEKAVGITT